MDVYVFGSPLFNGTKTATKEIFVLSRQQPTHKHP